MPENTQEPPSLEKLVIRALRQCFDPEIPVNIYDLGLIYKLAVDPSGKVDVLMTLTAPNCPVARRPNAWSWRSLTPGSGSGAKTCRASSNSSLSSSRHTPSGTREAESVLP